jgi:hypothetical protein
MTAATQARLPAYVANSLACLALACLFASATPQAENLAFPWIPIILAIISFLIQKSRGKKSKDALLTAALVGGGAYWLTTQTDWGQGLAAKADDLFGTSGGTTLKNPDGSDKMDSQGNPIRVNATTTGGAGVFDLLKSWGPAGTAAVLGVGAGAATGKLGEWLPWIIIGVVAFALIK